MPEFGTVLTCMDGRIQRKVNDYLLASMGVRHVDAITTAGMVKHVAAEDTEQTSTILENVEVSVAKHGSTQIAVVAHHDCAGNPVSDRTQKRQVGEAMARLRALYPAAEIQGLWLSEGWIVERIRV